MCKHCNGIWNDFYYKDVYEVSFSLAISAPNKPEDSNPPAIVVSNREDYEDFIRISFCPFCGRKLAEPPAGDCVE